MSGAARASPRKAAPGKASLSPVGYEVRTEVYEGPFDLLLRLIAAQEVDVWEVRISEIVDAFVAETRRLGAIDLEVATEFLVIAATLLELKCRRLLPGRDDVELEEELALLEARDYLLARLVEARTFQGAAQALSRLERAASRSTARRAGPDERFERCAPDLLAGVTPEDLLAAARRALSARPAPRVPTEHLPDEEVSVQDAIDELVATLPGRGPVTFRALTTSASPAHLVASFLALLELYKRELVELEQLSTFGDLTVTWKAPSAALQAGS